MTVKTADVIIVGGGVHGASTAYELAKAGVKTVLFEKEYLSSGGSGRSAAGLRQHFGTEVNLRMAKYNLSVFPTLEEELDTGMKLEFTQWGYMWVAYSESCMDQLRKNVKLQQSLDIPSVMLTPAEIHERWPYLNLDGIIGAAFCGDDGHINPQTLTMAYGHAARRLGAEICLVPGVYDDAYQRQYIEVEYYHDELGREVFDCTVFDFLCVKEGEYYPIYAQKLINIKDCSTTKYAVTYMRNFELVNEIQNNDDAFDKSDMYDYGINTLIIQLDYSSGDDMTLMKAQYSTADKHQKLSTSGTAAYYKKSANSTVYYSNKWDNIVSYINGYPVNSVQSGYCVNYYPDDLDKPEYRDYFHRRLGKALISMSELRYAYTCDLCENSKITSDGVFIDCSHYILSPTVNRYFNEIISDDEKYFSDSSLVWLGMTSQLKKFVDNLGVEYDISINMNGADFGNSINGFAVEFGKKYYKEKVNAGELGKIERYINENTTRIDEYEYPTEMIGKLTFTYGTVEDSKMDDKVLEISFSTHSSVSDPVADKEYYLCTLLVSRENYNDYSILSRVKLDPTSDEKVKVEFDIDLSSLIESWLSSDNTKYGVGYVPSYAIMSYSEEEGFVYLSRPMTIDIDSRFNDLLEEYVVVNANGKSYVSYMTRYNYGLEFIFTNAA